MSNKRSLKEFSTGYDENFIRKVKNRNKYRWRLRMYKRIWLYCLLIIDYVKSKIKYYENI